MQFSVPDATKDRINPIFCEVSDATVASDIRSCKHTLKATNRGSVWCHLDEWEASKKSQNVEDLIDRIERRLGRHIARTVEKSGVNFITTFFGEFCQSLAEKLAFLFNPTVRPFFCHIRNNLSQFFFYIFGDFFRNHNIGT
jgi:hypothetical protein